MLAQKPQDWNDEDADIESPNMAALGGLTDADEEEKEEDEVETEGAETVLDEEKAEEEEADELKALERLAEEARHDKPDLDDLGIEEEI